MVVLFVTGDRTAQPGRQEHVPQQGRLRPRQLPQDLTFLHVRLAGHGQQSPFPRYVQPGRAWSEKHIIHLLF